MVDGTVYGKCIKIGALRLSLTQMARMFRRIFNALVVIAFVAWITGCALIPILVMTGAAPELTLIVPETVCILAFAFCAGLGIALAVDWFDDRIRVWHFDPDVECGQNVSDTDYVVPHAEDPRVDDVCAVCLDELRSAVCMPLFVTGGGGVRIAVVAAPLAKCRKCGVVVHAACLCRFLCSAGSGCKRVPCVVCRPEPSDAEDNHEW